MRPYLLLALSFGCGSTEPKDDDDTAATGDDDDGSTTFESDDDDAPGDDDDDDAPITAVDVLFVIDDSASMAGNQSGFADAVDTLVSQLADLDPRYGVITTTSAVLVGGNLLDGSDATALADRLRVGTGGADDEQGLALAVEALAYDEWRGEALQLVIALTDEEDCSHGGALDGQSADECYLQPEVLIPAADLAAQFGQAQVHPFIAAATTTTGCEAFASARWADVSNLTAGRVHPICSVPFTTSFEAIGALLH